MSKKALAEVIILKKYLCIDIGGTFIKYGLLSEDGEILNNNKYLTPNNVESFFVKIEEVLESISDKIHGIAISSPGKINSNTGIISFGGKIPYLHNLNIVEKIQSKYNIPTAIINDGKAALLAEFWKGNLKKYNYSISFILGSAIGGGIIVDGKLLNGSHFQAGEFSFMPFGLGSAEELNQIGNIGDNLSAVNFIKETASKLGDQKMSGEQVFEKIEQKSPIAIRQMEIYARNIAYYLLTLHAVLDLDAIVIGGGISVQKSLILEINDQFNQMMDEIPGYALNLQKPVIQACKFYNDSNLIGALYHLLTFIESQERENV